MSQQDLKAFQETVNQNPGLRQQLQQQTTKADFVDTAIRLGKENGKNFTAAEVEEFLSSATVPTRSLTDPDLRSKVGPGGRPERYTYSKPGCTSH